MARLIDENGLSHLISKIKTALNLKIDKVNNANAGNIATLTSNGGISDSLVQIEEGTELDVVTELTDSNQAIPTSKAVKDAIEQAIDDAISEAY